MDLTPNRVATQHPPLPRSSGKAAELQNCLPVRKGYCLCTFDAFLLSSVSGNGYCVSDFSTRSLFFDLKFRFAPRSAHISCTRFRPHFRCALRDIFISSVAFCARLASKISSHSSSLWPCVSVQLILSSCRAFGFHSLARAKKKKKKNCIVNRTVLTLWLLSLRSRRAEQSRGDTNVFVRRCMFLA